MPRASTWHLALERTAVAVASCSVARVFNGTVASTKSNQMDFETVT